MSKKNVPHSILGDSNLTRCAIQGPLLPAKPVLALHVILCFRCSSSNGAHPYPKGYSHQWAHLWSIAYFPIFI